jgi:hypothetical protein
MGLHPGFCSLEKEKVAMVEKKINWTLNVSIPGGPSISASSPLVIEAYDMIEVELPYDSNNYKKVQILPGSSDAVKFLLIKADIYTDTAGHYLKYKVNDGTDESSDIDLTTPLHLFLGSGCVKILEHSPNNLMFKNELIENGVGIPVSVQILVGRKATP